MKKQHIGLVILALLLCSVVISSSAFVVLGATTQLGQATTGTYTDRLLSGMIVGSRFTAPSNGIANSISVYIYNPTSSAINLKCAIYGESANTLIATTQQISVASQFSGWQTLNFASGPSLTSGTSYSLVVSFAGDGCYLYYSSGSALQSWYAYQNYNYNFPNGPYSSFSGYGQSNNVYSIYATLTPSNTESSQASFSDNFDYGNTATLNSNWAWTDSVGPPQACVPTVSGSGFVNRNGIGSLTSATHYSSDYSVGFALTSTVGAWSLLYKDTPNKEYFSTLYMNNI